MSFYNYPQVVPHLVEDVNLKRARVETEEGDAIRVTGINCGDKVTIVPTLTEGTKIADYTINNVDGELYAPEAPTPPVTEVSITPAVSTGTKIADFSINNVAGELYTPDPSVTEASITPTISTGTKIADFSINNVAGALYAPQGGVGQAYPGSTGGEIFNYYGTDAQANTAGGPYSTTIGIDNKNVGSQNLVGGGSNTISGDGSKSNNIVFGHSNSVTLEKDSANFASSGVFGEGNTILLDKKETSFYASFLIGRNLMYDTRNTNDELNGCVIVGKFNPDLFRLTNPSFLVGCGNNANDRRTAMEINYDTTKICNSLTLPYDSTVVNAITPALSTPASIADMTLATKAYVDGNANMPMKHLANALTNLDETSFPMSFYTYCTNARPTDSNLRISLRINGSCYSKSLYNFLAVDGSFECYRSAYDSTTQTTAFWRYRFGWDWAAQQLSLTGSMSWEMSDAGAISNVTHGLTGLVITIYQIETY